MRPDPEAVAGNPRAALLRAGIAALLMIVLLFFVLGSEPEQEAAAPPPAPEAVAPEPEVIDPPPSLLLSQPEAPGPGAIIPPPVEIHTPQVAPAQDVAAVAPSAVPESAPESAPATAPAPVQPATPAPQPAPAAAAPASGAKPHFVQLADFGPLPAAKNLLDAAATAGHPGRLMHRVLVGPFASRDAARKVVEGGTKGIVVDSGGSWWVQAGVFSDAENADRQRATLSLAGRQVVVHGRAEVGPFPSRTAAEKALVGMREAFGKPLRDAAIVAVR